MTRLPPASSCSTVLVPSQLLENHRPPFLSQSVTATVSFAPGSPLSVRVIWSDAPPSIEMGASGLVMSWMLALPVNVPRHGVVVGQIELDCVPIDEIALLLIWYTRPPLRMMM